MCWEKPCAFYEECYKAIEQTGFESLIKNNNFQKGQWS